MKSESTTGTKQEINTPKESSHISQLDHIRQNRLEKLQTLREQGINPYPYRFEKQDDHAVLQHRYADLAPGTDLINEVRVAGRIMAIRNSGMFIDLQDATEKIQIFCHKEYLPPEKMRELKLIDIGDIIGVRGTIRRTPRGELSIKALDYTLLSKSILPLPEKFHGLTDVETRYRQRYLDFIMNPEIRDTFRKRSQIIADIRRFLTDRGFMEVETPMLHHIPGGAAAKPFVTKHNALDMQMYLRIAPELYLKRLIVGGLSEKVFEMNRNFRNEGISPKHNPEFTMMEVYQAYADYNDMMDLTEELISTVTERLHGSTKVAFGDVELDFTRPWARKTMLQAVLEETGVDFANIETAEEARAMAADLKVHVEENDSWGWVVEKVFEDKVEPKLIQPTHILDYPRETSPLAKVHRDNPRLVERFETRAYGWEIANAFSELSDPLDQRERFEAQLLERETGNEEAHHLDEDYIHALEYGLPPTGGLGIGIDRLVMLLTNSSNIRDIIAFPTLKQKS